MSEFDKALAALPAELHPEAVARRAAKLQAIQANMAEARRLERMLVQGPPAALDAYIAAHPVTAGVLGCFHLIARFVGGDETVSANAKRAAKKIADEVRDQGVREWRERDAAGSPKVAFLLADQQKRFNVSESTVRRWRREARKDRPKRQGGRPRK